MMKWCNFGSILVALGVMGSVSTASAQTSSMRTSETLQLTPVTFEDPFSPGTLDLTLSVGGLLYNTIEPGLDFGVIPVSDLGVISVGGSVNAGYCLVGCGLLNFFIDPLRISAWNITPLAKVNFHLNALPRALDIGGVDIYGGIALGASYQRAVLEDLTEGTDNRAEFSGVSVLFGPMLGVRYMLGGTTGFFVYGDWRFLAETGSASYQLASGGEVYDQTDLISRGGTSTHFGAGIRF